MRLPAINQQQRIREDARAFHEALYEAYQRGSFLRVPTSPEDCGRLAVKIQCRIHKFWEARGFRLHVERASSQTYIRFWLAPRRKAQAA